MSGRLLLRGQKAKAQAGTQTFAKVGRGSGGGAGGGGLRWQNHWQVDTEDGKTGRVVAWRKGAGRNMVVCLLCAGCLASASAQVR